MHYSRMAEARTHGPSPEDLEKNDCRKRVFQAVKALSSHFEEVGNSKETAGRTGFSGT